MIDILLVLLLRLLLMVKLSQSIESSNGVDKFINLAYKEAKAGNIKVAADLFFEAANISSDNDDNKVASQLYFNSGHAYSQLLDHKNAIKAYKKCLEVSRNGFRPCHIKIASVYRDIEDFENVQNHLLIAIDIEPSNADAYSYLAQILNNMKKFNQSITYYEAALARTPKDASLWGFVGDTYSNTKQVMKALNAYRKGLDLAQPNSLAYINSLIGLYFTSLDLFYWKNYERYTRQLIKVTRIQLDLYNQGKAPPSPLAPYRLLFLSEPTSLFLEIASSWSNELVRNTLAISSSSLPLWNSSNSDDDKVNSEKLNIGYISRRFEDYPGTQMMIRIFKTHDRSKGIKVHSFAHGPDDKSIEREIIKSTSDVFEDISAMSFKEAAQKIASYNIDILIDYDGIHDFNNMKVLALRPAKIQITWLGYAGSSGQGYRRKKVVRPNVEALEYIITDRYVSPPDRYFSQFYSENMIIMPRTYQPQDGERLLNTALISSKYDERKLMLSKYFPNRYQDKVLTSKWLICFNRPAKITPDAFEDWMMIMKKDSDTSLVLMVDSDDANVEILRNAAFWGVHPNRLLIFKRLPRREYYAVLAISDLFLDTRHYGSHTVASDAMAANVPVATISGETFASRVAHSLNAASKMEAELVSYSRKSFVDNVVQLLAGDNLRMISKKLIQVIGTCIFNDKDFTRFLEWSYMSVYQLKSMKTNSHLFFQNNLSLEC